MIENPDCAGGGPEMSPMCRRHPSGYSVLELVFVAGLIMTLSSLTVPNLLAGLDDRRAAGAARYVSTRLQRARMEAVMRSRTVAVKFNQAGTGRYTFTEYTDGNHNGVLADDIARGVDRSIGPPESLGDKFPGADFGVLPDLPPVDSGGTPPGDGPVRLGTGNSAAFTAIGTSTSGSLYIRCRNAQYSVRIFGETGRTRVLKFNTRSRRWQPL